MIAATNRDTVSGSRPQPAKIGNTLSLKDGAYLAGKSSQTILRWCQGYGIGKQLHPGAPWRVDPVGLAIIMAGDAQALEDYQAGRLDSDAVRRYDLEGAR